MNLPSLEILSILRFLFGSIAPKENVKSQEMFLFSVILKDYRLKGTLKIH